jgi:hypothetical protein
MPHAYTFEELSWNGCRLQTGRCVIKDCFHLSPCHSWKPFKKVVNRRPVPDVLELRALPCGYSMGSGTLVAQTSFSPEALPDFRFRGARIAPALALG